MLQWITEIDRAMLYGINGYHALWLDAIMWEFSGGYFWLIMLFTIGYMFIKQFKRTGWLFVAVGGLLFGISDQLANLSKNNLKRERPTHNTEIQHKINTVNDYRGGQYGFYSGHAANSFLLCSFAFFILRRKVNKASLLFVFAILTSFSRIYLGVHYPIDVLTGAFMGNLLGFGGFWLLCKFKGIPELLGYSESNSEAK